MINIQYTFEAAVTRTVWRNKLEEHQKREAGRRAGENLSVPSRFIRARVMFFIRISVADFLGTSPF